MVDNSQTSPFVGAAWGGVNPKLNSRINPDVESNQKPHSKSDRPLGEITNTSTPLSASNQEFNQEPRTENKEQNQKTESSDSPTPRNYESSEFSDAPSVSENDPFEHLPKPLPEETVLTWTSPSRPFKKRDRKFYTTVSTIVILISLILFFAGQFLPIAVVISIAFLSYVLYSVPPTDTEKQITTYGIRVENELYYWEEMGRFWFENKYGSEMVQIETIRFPGRITLLLDGLERQVLEDLLKEVLIMQKPEDTFFDKSASWLQEKIPLE